MANHTYIYCIPFRLGTVNEKAVSHNIILKSATPSPRPREGQPTNNTSLIWGKPNSRTCDTERPKWNLD